MIARIPNADHEKQALVRRNQMLWDLAHWLAEILPPDVLATGDARALYLEYLKTANKLKDSAGVTDAQLLGLVLTARTCVGNDFEQYYSAAGQVLRSTELSQSEKAAWVGLFLNGFPHLRDLRVARPRSRPAPLSELLSEGQRYG